MKELLANEKTKRMIVTLLVKYFQSYFKEREINYVLVGNYKILKNYQQSINYVLVGNYKILKNYQQSIYNLKEGETLLIYALILENIQSYSVEVFPSSSDIFAIYIRNRIFSRIDVETFVNVDEINEIVGDKASKTEISLRFLTGSYISGPFNGTLKSNWIKTFVNHISDVHMISAFFAFQIDINNTVLSTIEKFVLSTLKASTSTLRERLQVLL